MNWQRQARKFFGARHTARNPFHSQTFAFSRARLLVRFYYIALLYFALALLPDWPGLLHRTPPDALWPVAWLSVVDLRAGIAAILSLYLLGALAAAFLPHERWARIAAFMGLFEFVAFNNSYGKIGHSMHAWVLTAGLLIFLPAGPCEKNMPRVKRQSFLTIFWACQAILLLTYSMAGFGKIAGAIYQFAAGQNSAFTPDAMAAITAERLLETGSRSIIGPWVIEHPVASWPLLWGAIYLQFFSFWAAFRPSLQRCCAFALILFHLGSYFLLNINFAPNALLLALLFFDSPFANDANGWQNTIADLPLFGPLLARMLPKKCAS